MSDLDKKNYDRLMRGFALVTAAAWLSMSALPFFN